MAESGTINHATRHDTRRWLVFRARHCWSYYAILSLAFVAILVVAAHGYRAIDRELTEVTLSRSEAVAQLAAARLSENFGRLTDVAIALATRPRIQALVTKGRWIEATEFLHAVPQNLPFIARLLLVDVEGTLMADVPELPGVRGMKFSDRDWYHGVRRDWRPYISTVYTRTAAPQLKVFAVAVPINDSAGGVAGILVLQVRPGVLFEWLKEIDIGPEGFFYIIDSKEQIAFHLKHPDAQEITDQSETAIVRKLRGGKDGVEIGFDPVERENSISAYAQVPSYGWGVVTQQPVRASIGLAVKDQQLELLLIGFGVILLLGITAIHSAARIVIQRTLAADDRRVRAELEAANLLLRESEAKYRNLFDNMLEGFAHCRMLFENDQPRDFVYVNVNRAFEQLTGLKNVVGRKVTEVIPGIRESHPELFEVYGRVAVSGRSERFELYFKPLESWLSIAVYGAGEGCFVAVFDNITKRKRLEATLRESEERFRSAFENAPVGICLVATDGRFLRVNDALCRMLGYAESELLAKTFLDVTHPDDVIPSNESVRRLLTGKATSFDLEKRYLHAAGHIVWGRVRSFLMRKPDGSPLFFITHVQDITERKRAENESQTSREQLRVLTGRLSAAREEETTSLARAIHDELGQALTGLKMELSWLASRLGQGPRALKEKAASMIGLVDTTIDRVRNIAIRLRPKMLDDLGLVAAIEWQAHEFQKRMNVKCEMVSSVDIAKLGQHSSVAAFRITQEALTNIARHAAATRVDISLHGESGWLILEIRDNGKGIRVEEIAADKSIGLLGMRERALAAGGKLTVEGFPGRGTVVTLRVPLPAQ